MVAIRFWIFLGKKNMRKHNFWYKIDGCWQGCYCRWCVQMTTIMAMNVYGCPAFSLSEASTFHFHSFNDWPEWMSLFHWELKDHFTCHWFIWSLILWSSTTRTRWETLPRDDSHVRLEWSIELQVNEKNSEKTVNHWQLKVKAPFNCMGIELRKKFLNH